MPPAIYQSLLKHYLVQLAGFFERVAAPIEAPEKTSFGDLDIIVTNPQTLPFHPKQISTAVEAERTISSAPLYSFAVPYPALEMSFVQLDVQLCKAENFIWEVFHKSHGDLWNLLGSSIRPFGLTANDSGLYVRIPEIEALNRKKALIFLTADPDAVLDFLRLDKEVYRQPFETVRDMFDYACSTRFFRAEAYLRDGLKANDRKRLAQRELYRLFVDEYIPSRAEAVEDRYSSSELTRESILEEALHSFGRENEFNARVKAWRKDGEDLLHKREMRSWRRGQAMEDDTYANAWINSMRIKS
ncbi:MAG: hypothetical protein Q9219_004596 [cf. Caloplaca sp. 3 TL-2023]